MGVYDKLRMARELEALGVDVIEAGFPIASEDDFRAVRLISAEIRRPIIAGLARASEPDIRPRLGRPGESTAAAHPCFSRQL